MRPIDWLADWIVGRLDARAQLRLGIILVLASIPFYAYMPFSGEPWAIYLMSALALSLSGLAFLVGAEVLEEQEKK